MVYSECKCRLPCEGMRIFCEQVQESRQMADGTFLELLIGHNSLKNVGFIENLLRNCATISKLIHVDNILPKNNSYDHCAKFGQSKQV